MSTKIESHLSEEQGATGHECGDEGHITEEARRAIDEIGQVKAGARSHRGPDERVQDGDDVAAGPMWPGGDGLSGEEGHLWHHLSDSERSRAVELIAQGRLMEALDLATSGDLEFQCGSDRARIADDVNLVARANGDVELALEAMTWALRLEPRVSRLCNLCTHIAGGPREVDRRLAAALEAIEGCETEELHERLKALVQLLLGRHDAVIHALDTMPGLGWESSEGGRSGDNIAAVVVPYFLVATSTRRSPPQASALVGDHSTAARFGREIRKRY